MNQEFSLTSETRNNCLIIATSGYVNNIENYAVKTSFMSGAGGGTLMIGDPRTYGGVLSIKF